MSYTSNISFHTQRSVVLAMIWLILIGLVWSSVAQLRDQLGLATSYGWSPFSSKVSAVFGALAGTEAAAWGMLVCGIAE